MAAAAILQNGDNSASIQYIRIKFDRHWQSSPRTRFAVKLFLRQNSKWLHETAHRSTQNECGKPNFRVESLTRLGKI